MNVTLDTRASTVQVKAAGTQHCAAQGTQSTTEVVFLITGFWATAGDDFVRSARIPANQLSPR